MEGFNKIDFELVKHLKVEPGLYEVAASGLRKYYEDQFKAMVGAIRLKFEARKPEINERGIAWDGQQAYFGSRYGENSFRSGEKLIRMSEEGYSWVALPECQNEERPIWDADIALKVVREYQIQAKQNIWSVSVDGLVAWLERGGK